MLQECIGCGIKNKQHPWVGIGRENLDTGEGNMVAHNVCDPCYKDPGHRTVRSNLKVHFFQAEDSPIAIAAALRSDRQSKNGEDIGVQTS